MKITFCGNLDPTKTADAAVKVRVSRNILSQLGRRNSWVTIKNESSGNKIYRLVLGSRSEWVLSNEQIEIDYDSWVELTGDVKSESKKLSQGEGKTKAFNECDLTLTKTSWLAKGFLLPHWKSPIHTHRVSIRLALVSLAIALVSLTIALLGMLTVS